MKKPLIAQTVEYLSVGEGEGKKAKVTTPSGQTVIVKSDPEGFRIVLMPIFGTLSGNLFSNSVLSNYYTILTGEPNDSDWFVEHNRPTLRAKNSSKSSRK